MAIEIDHEKTVRECFVVLYESILSSFTYQKFTVAILDKVRKQMHELPVNIADHPKSILNNTKTLLNDKRSSQYRELRVCNDLFILAGLIIDICKDRDIVTKNRRYFVELRRLIFQIFRQSSVKYSKDEKSLLEHIRGHLEEWIKEQPGLELLRVFRTELGKVRNNNPIILIYLARCKKILENISP